jgi:hypothetical protein
MPQRDRRRRLSHAGVAGGRKPASASGLMGKFNEVAPKLVSVAREELRREGERYKIDNATRRGRRKEEGAIMAGRKVPVTLPSGQQGEGIEVQVDESNERWSEFTLQDGAIIRAKLTITSAVRVDGQFDQLGNPLYVTNLAPVLTIVSVPEQYRKKVQ